MIKASAPVTGLKGLSVVTLRNARDIRRLVRAERSQLGYMIGISSLISVLLSLFLARTIVRPLQLLAHAAGEVRFGQAREVQVPRLPSRRDEIGALARSVSDMSHALRQRMDAIEAFAADVAHELKNPLASLASAVQSLKKVNKPELRNQLLDVITDDVVRLDRLVTDISDLSRVDAHIARTRFQTIDVGSMIEGLLKTRSERGQDGKTAVAFARPQSGSALVRGDAGQLVRVIDNLLDNAVSFSPPKGSVRVAATRTSEMVVITVDDDGPGVPEGARTAIFERFHSDRPAAEFGRHSGLGLAIARTIIDAHGGTIRVQSRDAGQSGASFIIELPPAML
jgi:two-component system, OmpR family, sensor histidine kinase ChvG